ncbi:MAG: trypsin-like peptidase domain-containing protein [Deltaproteobacteria bacterium]|nr:trypsin-like peptidase domain-containing protein [Deltaproteobacteria bacterium]
MTRKQRPSATPSEKPVCKFRNQSKHFAQGAVLALGSFGLLCGLAQPALAQPTAAPSTPVADAIALGSAFTDVASRVLPSVVSLRVESEQEAPGFFGIPGMFMGPGGPETGEAATQIVRGSGSGVILREDGVILTNYHVVERARRISVHLRDGRLFRGRVLGVDRSTDLALVKIDAQGLPVARLGDSDSARPGEWVLAIGAPLGLEATVTHGILSATGRAHLGVNAIEDYLQTDASINPGNSGGPLVNLRGEVLGINTMIAGRNSGIGFAVSAGIARFVVDQVLRTGRVARGWIGVSVQDLSPSIAESIGLGTQRGALVNAIDARTPAERAGLRIGDVIVAVDSVPVTEGDAVVRAITRKVPGERLALSVLREGQRAMITVLSEHRPGPADVPAAEVAQTAVARSRGHGLRIAAVDPRFLSQLGVREPALGVVSVEPGSAADDAGIRRGDLILRVDGAIPMSITAVDQAARDGRITLLVRRRDSQLFIPLTL